MMKKLLSTAIMLLFVFFVNAQSKKEMICKKWEISIESMLTSVPEEDREAARAQFETMLADSYILFKNDGTYESYSAQEGNKNGTWELIEDGAALRTVDKTETVIMELYSLTNDSMEIMRRGQKGGLRVTMVPKTD